MIPCQGCPLDIGPVPRWEQELQGKEGAPKGFLMATRYSKKPEDLVPAQSSVSY